MAMLMLMFFLVLLLLVRPLLTFVAFVKLHFTHTSKLGDYLRTKDGEPAWALVTEAGEALGPSFAFKLAAQGFHVVLQGRDPYMLTSLRTELEHKVPHQRFVHFVVNPELPEDDVLTSFQRISQFLSRINLKILVNNTMANPPHELKTIEQLRTRELAVQIGRLATFPLQITSHTLLRLADSEPSLIINIGSTHDVGTPLQPFFGPCKALIATWSTELARDMRIAGRQIDVLCLRPGKVMTLQSGFEQDQTVTHEEVGDFLTPTADVFVEAALDKVGCGRTVVVPYWPHAVLDWVTEVLPEVFREWFYVASLEHRYRNRQG